MRLAAVVVAAATFSACGHTVTADPSVPKGAIIRPGTYVTRLLDQCSRGTPLAGEGTWQPSGSDIAKLERELRVALVAESRPDHAEFSKSPDQFGREYVGIVRGGRRFIYGNYFPLENGDLEHSETSVCDGGASYFGAEFDVKSGKFTRVDFNGAI